MNTKTTLPLRRFASPLRTPAVRVVGAFAKFLQRDAAHSNPPSLTCRFSVSALAGLAGTLCLLLAANAQAALRRRW